MNPYPIIAALILWGASLAGTGWWFYGSGQDSEKAKQADIDKAIQTTRDAAMKGAGDAIRDAKIINTVTKREVETITREVPVYRACVHDDRVLDSLDRALRGEPAGGGKLPEGSGLTAKQDVWGDSR